MPGIKIRGYGSVELDEENTRSLNINEPVKRKELYRDDSLERDEE